MRDGRTGLTDLPITDWHDLVGACVCVRALAGLEDDGDDLDDDAMYGAGSFSGSSLFGGRGGGGGGGGGGLGAGGGMGSLMSAEAVLTQKVVHQHVALEADDDCDEL